MDLLQSSEQLLLAEFVEVQRQRRLSVDVVEATRSTFHMDPNLPEGLTLHRDIRGNVFPRIVPELLLVLRAQSDVELDHGPVKEPFGLEVLFISGPDSKTPGRRNR